ncbi:imelysin family protein [Pseudobacteriovorax antillogorgiicola]|uniref:Putative iron-regulated protein n=1 Tax=Pseudobacteriovorax antillogorgiicola TaxID=1513793 RepID=A0A1Y6CE94_9BACT|nr:imelysin family protein [Pseudobacteriovorax antillogorgiicola]TCS47676.1 putative iron-regulated protein [Pseudobacteriovorax antillogorgiicola]SMF59604.1 putative iron-regulated protein [Pseudobacteriovorax antillogorgiicola]
MKYRLMSALLLSSTLLGSCTDDDEPIQPTSEAAVQNYAAIVYANYTDALETATALKSAVDSFVEAPSEAGLEEAKQAWLASRDPYGQSEAYRFYDGPIDDSDGPEGQLNAWPLDEVYLDYVDGDEDAGIINSTLEISKASIAGYNEGGQGDILSSGSGFDAEKAIATGYHAIEFLLWGQDLSATGPGTRPYTDYTTRANADRRGTYLKLTAELLVEDLTTLVADWAPEDASNYRNASFLAQDTSESLKAMFTSIGILAKGELGGERIDVALANKSQEDEHSCFSDNTNADIYNNALGVQNVYLGQYGSLTGTGLSALVAEVDPDLDEEIKTLLDEAVTLAKTLPLTFDQIIVDESSDGYAQANNLVIKLQEVAEKLVSAATAVGLGTISVELPE